MIEVTIEPIYLDTDDDAVMKAKLEQVLCYARDLGFLSGDDVELYDEE